MELDALVEMVTNSEYSRIFMSLGIVGVFIAIMLVRTLIKVLLIGSIALLAYYFFVQGGTIPGLSGFEDLLAHLLEQDAQT